MPGPDRPVLELRRRAEAAVRGVAGRCAGSSRRCARTNGTGPGSSICISFRSTRSTPRSQSPGRRRSWPPTAPAGERRKAVRRGGHGPAGACRRRTAPRSISSPRRPVRWMPRSVLDAGLAPIAESLQTALIAAQDAVSELRSLSGGGGVQSGAARAGAGPAGHAAPPQEEVRRDAGGGAGLPATGSAEELHALTHSEERIAELEAELARQRRGDGPVGAASSRRRPAGGREPNSSGRLVAELRRPEHGAHPLRGADRAAGPGGGVGRRAGIPAWLGRVEFLISPNPGEPVRPLARIASGGEMSRIMLALKSAMAGVSAVPTLIFDEIDVGVGGRTAEVLGEKMAALSRTAQVLCVTHLPQIAGMASRHFQVQKAGRRRADVGGSAGGGGSRAGERAGADAGRQGRDRRPARARAAGRRQGGCSGKAGVQVFRCSGVQEADGSGRTPEHPNT